MLIVSRPGRRDRRLAALHARASAARLPYPEVGATGRDELPAGYGVIRRSVQVGAGQPAFERAAGYVSRWGAQRGLGLRIYPDSQPPDPGKTVLLTFGLGPFTAVIPCRVVWTVLESDRVGFAYGTLPGHPEQGEEAFVVELDAAGGVWFRVTAFSRPAAWYTRLGGPATRLAGRLATDSYVRAVRAAARPPSA